MSRILGVFVAATAFVAASGWSMPAAHSAPEPRLSSTELARLLNSEIPPNCTEYTDSSGACLYIICDYPSQPGDWPRGLYACPMD